MPTPTASPVEPLPLDGNVPSELEVFLHEMMHTDDGDDYRIAQSGLALFAEVRRLREENDGLLTTWADSRARHLTAEIDAARLRQRVEAIGRRAHTGDGSRTMDELMRDMMWVDDECRAILVRARALLARPEPEEWSDANT